MKAKFKIKLIGISVLCALCALLCGLWLLPRAVTAEVQAYNAVYDLGETITVFDQTVTTPSGEKDAEAFVVYPDGTRQKAEKRLTLSQAGLYTIEYRATTENAVYKEEHKFSVYYPMHSVTNSLDFVGYTEADKYGLKGVSVSLSSGSTYHYASVIDLSAIRAGEPLISLCVTPETIGNESSGEAKILYVRVEDALDENNYFLIRLRPYNSYANASARKLVTVTARACTQTQWVGAEKGKKNSNMHVDNHYGFYSKGSFYGFGLEEGGTPGVISLGYDNQTQTVFCYSPNGSTYGDYVTDFMNTKYYTSTWGGFKGDKVKLSVYASSYVASAFHFNITEIAGCDLSQKYLTDLNASDIEVDFGEYTDTTYPDAVVGKPYRIFPASLPISYTQNKSFVNVYTGYETNMKTDVNIVNGCFTPRWATEHTIEYSYVDTFGNKKIKTVVVNAKAESEQIQMTIDQTPISLEVGQYIHLPAITQLHGGDGKVNVTVLLKNGTAIEDLTGKTSHRILQTGEYKLYYIAVDYNGQTVEKEVSVTATASTAPSFDKTPVFANYYLQGGKYELPTWNGEDFSSGELQTVDTSASVSVGGAPVTVSNGEFTVPAGEKIQFTYNVTDGNGNTNSVTIERPILDVGLNGDLRMEKYFVATNGSVTAQEKALLLSANAGAQNARFEFVRELNASNFSASFVLSETGSNFESVKFILAEYADQAKTVEISFGNKNNKVGVSVNGGTVYETSYAFASSETKIKIELVGKKLTVGSKVLSVEEYLDGSAFTGFAFAWFSVAVDGITSNSAIEINSLNNQSLNNIKVDTIEPTIYMTTDFGGERALNSEFIIEASFALDVLNPYATLTLSVKKGSAYVQDKNTGEVLQNVTAEKEYAITLDDFGSYTFLYEYSDGASTANGSLFRYVVSVKDVQAPTISVSKTEIKGEVEETISLPSYTVSDNYSKEDKLKVFVQVISEDGIYQELENNKVFKPTKSGKYIVRFWVMDQNNNYTYTDVICRVS